MILLVCIMRVFNCGCSYVIVLDKWEKVTDSLRNFAREHGISSGFFFGIGAVKDPKIGYYDVFTKEYVEKTLSGEFEVISLVGNITLDEDGNVIVHAHISLGDNQYRVYGGHLIQALVSVTLELLFIPTIALKRVFDEKTQLKLIRFACVE